MIENKLLRKSVAITIAFALFFVSYIPIAAEEINLSFIPKDIYLNGILIKNYELNYPLVTKSDRTYVPLTKEMGQALGFETFVDMDRKLIQLLKTTPSEQPVRNSDLACNLEDQKGAVLYDFVVAFVTEYDTEDVQALSSEWRQIISPIVWSLSSFVSEITNGIVEPTLTTEVFMLEDHEILFVDDVAYIPLSSFCESKMFAWDAYYDLVTGLYISSQEDIPANSYYSENNASYIEGRASYIKNVRPELSLYDSYYYEYIFRHEADIYDVDQELIMAVSRTESTFQRYIVSHAGAVGMMQIMPRTAIAYGITEKQLEDPHINIEFGTRYVRDRLWIYNGDIIKALAAYNQGTKKVNSGNYKTGYAEKCVYNENVIDAWIANRGYSTSFESRIFPKGYEPDGNEDSEGINQSERYQ
jgi:hypothetical protein